MRDQITVLQELSLLDEQILRRRTLVKAREAELVRQRGEEGAVREAAQVEKQTLEDARGRRRGADREVATCRDNKAHFERQLRQVKTDTEYQALLREIAAAERSASAREDQILELMELEEETEKRISEIADKLAALERQTTQVEAALRAATDQADEIIPRLEGERRELLGLLSPKILGKYERLRQTLGDRAIVRVTEGSCGGCHYGLPPQVANEVRQGRQVRFCEGCGRFLVTLPGAD